MKDDAEIVRKISPGNEYSLIDTTFDTMVFSVAPHTFSQELITAAAEEWMKKPGKYDNFLVGFKSVRRHKNTVIIEAVPVLYSQHRYITKCIIEDIHISESDRILVAGVVNLSHILVKGKKHFLFGIKKSGYLGAGKIEIIPQGFCDYDPLKKTTENYIASSIENEMHEEVSPEIIFKNFSYLGLATDDVDKQYAVLTECCILETETVLTFVNNTGNHNKEHDHPILVSEDELPALINNTRLLLQEKTGTHFKNKIQLSPTSKAVLYLYLASIRHSFK